jgi:hypothetical protein
MQKEYTLSLAKTNLYAMIMLIPIGIILGIPYFLIYGFEAFSIKDFSLIRLFGGGLIVVIIFLGGVVVHELLHALGWMFFPKGKWKSISFGIKWEFLTPYCHCNEPLKKWQFTLGAALPGIVLGLLPAFISYINGSFAWWFFGFFFTISAGGDIIALWMLRKVPRGCMVKDHPSELGFVVED